ncbi:hypothetical protein RKD49_007189 [Streptomyces glaucescens]
MKLPSGAHTSHDWLIHRITHDFHLEDVWALPTPGGPDDFPQLLETFFQADFVGQSSLPTRVLWAARWKLGALFGWDGKKAGLGRRVPTLRDRLPADVRERPTGPGIGKPFSMLYRLENEWAAEMANRTVHAVLHLAWVPDGHGGHRGQMAVLVRPNGLFGTAYMAAIKPFRYLVVYPQMMRWWARNWERRATSPA